MTHRPRARFARLALAWPATALLAMHCGAKLPDITAPGAPCGSNPQASCSAAMVCVGFGGPEGGCYQLCDPAAPVCAASLSCLPIFTIADAGICAQPAPTGTPCNESQQVFCSAGQVCLGQGACLKRCNLGLTSDCPQLESCVRPSPFQPTVTICVQPQPIGASCSPAKNIYCDNGAFCVFLSPDAGHGQCLQDCTDGGACPPTQSCQPVSEQGATLQLGVCY
jgi:hypothetical protein